jgi:hypothetical protein
MRRPVTAAKLLIGLSLIFATAHTLSADIIGTFDIGGDTASVGLGGVTFGCIKLLTVAPCPKGSGNDIVDNASGNVTPNFLEGAFVGNLTNAADPLNTPLNINNWLVITPSIFNSSAPTVELELQFLPLGNFSNALCSAKAAPGQTCTPNTAPITVNNPTGKSDFDLTNTQTGFTAGFDVLGRAFNSTGGSEDFTGTFTATVNGESYQTALKQILAGKAPRFTYTASFTLFTTVPEPSFLPLFGGMSLVLVGVVAYRRRLQRQ